jgi:hypothetical protein
MAHCARCDRTTLSSTMSRFNTDILCLPCERDERDAPGYPEAHAAEHAAVAANNWNFSGVGLSPDAAAFLAARRAERLLTTPVSEGR